MCIYCINNCSGASAETTRTKSSSPATQRHSRTYIYLSIYLSIYIYIYIYIRIYIYCGSIMNRAVLFARSTKAAVDDHVTTLTRPNACDSEQPPRTGAVRCNPPPVSQFVQGALRIVALAGGCPPHCARARLAEPNQDMAESRPV